MQGLTGEVCMHPENASLYKILQKSAYECEHSQTGFRRILHASLLQSVERCDIIEKVSLSKK